MISPEGCASILWKSADRAKDASEALNLTADKLKELHLIDEIVAEPLGGAHRDIEAMAKSLKETLRDNLNQLEAMPINELLEQRYEKLMSAGRPD